MVAGLSRPYANAAVRYSIAPPGSAPHAGPGTERFLAYALEIVDGPLAVRRGFEEL